jgi:hypothetical protein
MIIKSATYGGVDFTTTVVQYILTNSLSDLRVPNAMFGDPQPNVRKYLTVVYEIDGIEHYAGTADDSGEPVTTAGAYNAKSQLVQLYHQWCNTPMDINEHLPTLMRFAKKCDHITEMGVRGIVSTYGLLMGKPKTMVSYDICDCDWLPVRAMVEQDTDFKFIQADTRECIINPTDLLFIDTLHNYNQLKIELARHADKVKKYLIFHDTSSFEFHGETEEIGLWPAIAEFLDDNPDWRILERFHHNNGLTILARTPAIPRVLVMTANTGASGSNDMVEQVGTEVDFICIDNDNYPLRNNSLSPRMLGKMPKMLAWEMYPGYDYYIWIDIRFKFSRSDAVGWFINQLHDNDAAFFVHPGRNKIIDELIFVENEITNNNEYFISRYSGENMRSQVETYLADPEFVDNTLFAAGAFIYTPTLVANESYNLMKEWFYQNCVWSVQDQLSLPYVLQKFNTRYTTIPESIFDCIYLK